MSLTWWHPKPTLLNLVFSHTGEWVKIPKNRGIKGGPDYYAYHVGRLEKYIDPKGITKRAVSYGDDADKLIVWFDYKEMLEGLVDWILPETPFWFNNKKWKNILRNPPPNKNKNSGRGAAQKGKGPAPRNADPRGRGHHTQERARESYRGDHDMEYEFQDQGYYNDYNAPEYYEGYDFPRSSGAGRSSGPASHPKRDNTRNP